MQTTASLPSEAKRYLSDHKYDIQTAISAFLDAQQSSRRLRVVSPALTALFDRYKSKSNPDEIDIDGTIAYLLDLSIEPEDHLGLILAFLLNSPSIGIFNRRDFLSKWGDLGIGSLEQMRSFLVQMNESMMGSTGHGKTSGPLLDFQHLYNYTFNFLKDSPIQKCLDPALAVEYWKLLLPLNIPRCLEKHCPQNSEATAALCSLRLDQWCEFVLTIYGRPILSDTWRMFYLFFREVVCLDPVSFKNYSEMDAWPSICDEFVEHLADSGLLTAS